MEQVTRNRRKSTLKACHRCHRRKQRCVGYPSCTNCQAANLSCQRTSISKAQRYATLSKHELIGKIIALEQTLPANQEPPLSAESEPGASVPSDRYQTPGVSHGSPDDMDLPHFEQQLSAENQRDKSPSEISILHAGFQSARSQSRNRAARQTGSLSTFSQAQGQRAPPPSEEDGLQFLMAYLEGMHRRSPFLNFSEILDYHRRRHEELDSDTSSKYRAFKLYMVYAIGAASLHLTRTCNSVMPDSYLATALHFKPSTEEGDLIQELEAIMLVIFYKLRSSLDPRVWYLIGHAMRSAIDAGMHRASYYHNLDSETAHSRRCLFWCIYVLERHIGWALKRPLSITDRNIDVEVPPELITRNFLGYHSDGNPLCLHSPVTTSGLSAATAGLQLTRIVSPLFFEVHRVDVPLSELKCSLPSLLQQLEAFESVIPKVAEHDRDWVLMHYHDATRKLIETFLEVLEPDDPFLGKCIRASGRMCQLFKRMRMKALSAYSFLLINSFFIAGLTICYILFKSPMLWSPSTANDLRACSSTLVAMAERNNTLRKYRDVLDNIIDGIMEHIEQASSPCQRCPCSNCSPEVNNDSPEETPSSFNRLKNTFSQLNFEFPPQSYPEYSVWPPARQNAYSLMRDSAPPVDDGNGSSLSEPEHPLNPVASVMAVFQDMENIESTADSYDWGLAGLSTGLFESSANASSMEDPVYGFLGNRPGRNDSLWSL